MALASFRTFDDAIHAAQTRGKLLLIVFSSERSAACKQMLETTWVAPEVVQWVEQHAVPLELDVLTHPEVRERFAVESVPTLVLMRGAAMLDKTTGARSPAKLVEWFENAKSGRTELGMMRAALRDDDPFGWLKFAMVLSSRGHREEAFAMLERCWLETKGKAAWLGARASYVVRELQLAADDWPFAKAKIETWRDEAAKNLTSPDGLNDWLALNDALGDSARVLSWFDSVKGGPRTFDISKHRRLTELLKRHDRLADYGRLLERPVDVLRMVAKALAAFDQPPPGMFTDGQLRKIREEHLADLRSKAGDLLEALKAAGRTDDALELEAKALELDPTDEMRDALATA